MYLKKLASLQFPCERFVLVSRFSENSEVTANIQIQGVAILTFYVFVELLYQTDFT
jgi:hypothetical protein